MNYFLFVGDSNAQRRDKTECLLHQQSEVQLGQYFSPVIVLGE